MYFNVNLNGFFKLIKVHILVSELYIYQNARCNDKETCGVTCALKALIYYTVVRISFPYSWPKQIEAQRADMCMQSTALFFFPKWKIFDFKHGYHLLNDDLRGFPQYNNGTNWSVSHHKFFYLKS